MCVTIESLDLPSYEHDTAVERIRELAYEKWQAAGRPPGDGLEFWLEAEQRWLQHEYIPVRSDLVAQS